MALRDPDDIRTLFSTAMSDMYRAEVPLYGDLIALVGEVNAATLEADRDQHDRLATAGDLDRLNVERHGAIRVGTAEELATIRRLFAVMGMYPVSYYDLSVAGVPVHSTAFRPLDPAALRRNPFRVFTSLLRLDLIDDEALAAEATRILSARRIFTPRVLDLIQIFETQGGLTAAVAEEFVREALETFRWHGDATVSLGTYRKLHDAHRLIADVVSFRGPHINHLTPRTLDIDAAQAAMPQRGIPAKAVIEGPPRRACPILLRQTSFKALDEPIAFEPDGTTGTHSARFGEIEQRGVALTRAGRKLYDELLGSVAQGNGYEQRLAERFQAFPDDWAMLRIQGLAFFHYTPTAKGLAAITLPATVDALIEQGFLQADPMTYEDFLPISAAGIFQSNLGTAGQQSYGARANRAAFEQALGATVHDEFQLYAEAERASLDHALAQLALKAIA